MEYKNKKIATLLSQPYSGSDGSITPPIVQTSLFSFDSYEAFEERMAGVTNQAIYTRVQNPTVQAFEEIMAEIESAEEAVAFASGMAAISSTVMALVAPGDRIACVEHVYPDAYRFFERVLRPFGVGTDYFPIEEFRSNPDLLNGYKIAYLESPNSVVFETLDLHALSKNAQKNNVITIIDNSWATPIFQRPIELGIDIVIHSASKYISGHSDTVAGVVSSSNQYIARIRDISLPLFGGKLAPFEAWLLIRGLRTLNVRMRAHEQSAGVFIQQLKKLSCITQINAPGLNTVPGLLGRSGLLSVVFDDTVDIRKFSNSLSIFKLGVSWGGFESLIIPSRVALAQAGEANSMQKFNVPRNLVRLSIGLEDVEDLWADFEHALNISVK